MSTKTRIMVVEDQNIVAMDIRPRLEALGYEVSDVVPSGEEAVKKAGESRPDMVLMDIELKGKMDGIEAADLIGRRYQIPIIFLTALVNDGLLERAKATGPYGYLVKPAGEKEIQSAIEISLYKRDMERRLRESEERYRTIADFTYDWEYWIGPDGHYIYVSPKTPVLKTVIENYGIRPSGDGLAGRLYPVSPNKNLYAAHLKLLFQHLPLIFAVSPDKNSNFFFFLGE